MKSQGFEPRTTDSSNELRQELERVTRQLDRYAHDLKELLENERKVSQSLLAANAQSLKYAQDLQEALDSERAKSLDLQAAYEDTVLRLIRASQFRDLETGAHLQRIGGYVSLIALQLGYTSTASVELAAASAVHDLGKIGVPDSVLHEPGPLSAAGWAYMHRHPEIGARILEGSPSPVLRLGQVISLTHHERWDGSGYPRGLVGEEIPQAGRIVMLADQYDALRSIRPYKPAFSHARTRQTILLGDGRSCPEHFDPELLVLFADVENEFDEIWKSHPEIKLDCEGDVD